MHKFLKALILSIFIHCVLFLLLTFIIHEPQFSSREEIELTFLVTPMDESTIKTSSEDLAVTPKPSSLSPQKIARPLKKIDQELASITLVDSTVIIKAADDSLSNVQLAYNLLTSNTDSLRFILFRRQQLFDEIMQKLTDDNDSAKIAHKVLASNFSNMFIPNAQMKPLGAGNDYIERKLNSRIFDYDPNSMLNVPELLGSIVKAIPNLGTSKKSIHKKPKIIIMPTLTEINILKTLWDKNNATQNMIYVELDTSIRLTAEDLDMHLEDMFLKGWITRKKISPENVFQVMTPVGSIDIEMSQLNRKNLVYAYRALATRSDVFKYLDSKLFLFDLKNHHTALADSLHSAKRDSLLTKMVMLLKAD